MPGRRGSERGRKENRLGGHAGAPGPLCLLRPLTFWIRRAPPESSPRSPSEEVTVHHLPRSLSARGSTHQWEAAEPPWARLHRITPGCDVEARMSEGSWKKGRVTPLRAQGHSFHTPMNTRRFMNVKDPHPLFWEALQYPGY